MATAIALYSIGKTYRAGIAGCSAHAEVFRDVSLTVARGDAVAIVGRRGVGKSTLLLCAAGLLRPDAGTVTWYDHAGRGSPRPNGVALVAGTASLAPHRTVRETLEGGAALHPHRAPGSAGERTAAALERAGLSEYEDAPVARLDAIARLRLTIAHALAAAPHTLLIDEPFTALAPAPRRDACAMLRALHRTGTTLVMATRDGTALGVPVRAFLLDDGRLVACETTEPMPSATLELRVAAPQRADRLLRAHVGDVERHGSMLRVPLARSTAEEVLAYCHAERIAVHASRVVREEANAR